MIQLWRQRLQLAPAVLLAPQAAASLACVGVGAVASGCGSAWAPPNWQVGRRQRSTLVLQQQQQCRLVRELVLAPGPRLALIVPAQGWGLGTALPGWPLAMVARYE